MYFELDKYFLKEHNKITLQMINFEWYKLTNAQIYQSIYITQTNKQLTC